MEVVYRLEAFEGPMELLLHLIEKDKLDIYEISIVGLADQYLDYIEKAVDKDFEYMSDFIMMAATLIDIKTKLLLPKEIDENTGEEINPAKELIDRLVEYKEFKKLSEKLSAREEKEKFDIYKEKTLPEEVLLYEPEVNLDKVLEGINLSLLRRIFDDVMRKSEERVDNIRADFGKIRKEKISLSTRINDVLRDIREIKKVSFRTYLGKKTDKINVVVTFLALLELIKAGRINFTQENIFDDIYIENIDCEDEGELSLDLLED